MVLHYFFQNLVGVTSYTHLTGWLKNCLVSSIAGLCWIQTCRWFVDGLKGSRLVMGIFFVLDVSGQNYNIMYRYVSILYTVTSKKIEQLDTSK